MENDLYIDYRKHEGVIVQYIYDKTSRQALTKLQTEILQMNNI